MSKPNLTRKNFCKYPSADNQEIEKCICTVNRYKWDSAKEIDVKLEIRNLDFIPIEMCDFSFKSVNNYHFSNEFSPECTFYILRLQAAPKETIKYFFMDCPITSYFTNNHFDSFWIRQYPYNSLIFRVIIYTSS